MTKKIEKIKIGLLGAGWIGQHHGNNIINNQYAELTAIADTDKTKMQNFQKKTGSSASIYEDYQVMLKRDDIDAVVIATPNFLHSEQAIASADAGKHIYLEKPMAINLEDSRKIAKKIQKAGVKSAMGYHRRFNPLVQYAKQLQDQGKLGEMVMVESDYIHHIPADWDIWEWAGQKNTGGHPIHGGGGHNIDLLRYFCGEVEEVSCYKDIRMPRKIQIDTEDIAIINLLFKNKTVGRVAVFLGPIIPFTFTLRLFGTKGTVDNNRVWLDSIPLFYEPGHEDDCILLPHSWIPDNVQGGVSETWSKCMDTFIDDIRLDRKPFNDVISGFNTASICSAAVESAIENKIVKPESL